MVVGLNLTTKNCLKRRKQFNAILKCVISEMHTELHDIHLKDHVNEYNSANAKTT